MRPIHLRSIALVLVSACLSALTSCPVHYYHDHQFPLAAAPAAAFVLPDSTAGEGFVILPADRKRYPACPGLRVYDLWEVDARGRIGPTGQNGVFVGLDTLPGPGPVLHVLMRGESTRPGLAAWPGIVARLVVQESGTTVDSLPIRVREVGQQKAVTDWCKGERW